VSCRQAHGCADADEFQANCRRHFVSAKGKPRHRKRPLAPPRICLRSSQPHCMVLRHGATHRVGICGQHSWAGRSL